MDNAIQELNVQIIKQNASKINAVVLQELNALVAQLVKLAVLMELKLGVAILINNVELPVDNA